MSHRLNLPALLLKRARRLTVYADCLLWLFEVMCEGATKIHPRSSMVRFEADSCAICPRLALTVPSSAQSSRQVHVRLH
eukprot:CAMPEP_0119318532 /NCGR_PEP_ID=MMETSP1333-20130426/46720_1 /TAXON_ID=418940 /ORGANISM="Scyphosphaera apsteinii, Strain RCC1455" /LENGTH=78 /DNA_ID=CAMNT_0007324733 /DNA_START=221 /DNA_END=454 /DNA_ORIENTATION=+